MPTPRLDPNDKLTQMTADMMLRAAKMRMDARAWELFDLWFRGTAPPVLLLENDTWAKYMNADAKLTGQVRRQLEVHADGLRDEAKGAAVQRKPLSITFHAETGSASGGYYTGYAVLHGSNKAVGDFEITGFYTIRASADGAYSVVYDELTYTFNDLVDANKRWTSDVVLLNTAHNMAKVLRVGPPRDYHVRIRWREPKAVTIPVPALLPGQGPAWLKTFPNR